MRESGCVNRERERVVGRSSSRVRLRHQVVRNTVGGSFETPYLAYSQYTPITNIQRQTVKAILHQQNATHRPSEIG